MIFLQQWTQSVYQSFNIARAQSPDFKKAEKSNKALKPIREEKLYETDRDPSNSSGCVIS
jgi:hypothetical protein